MAGTVYFGGGPDYEYYKDPGKTEDSRDPGGHGWTKGQEPGPALEAELIAYARQRLAHHKCPRSVDFHPELPRLPTGKLYKQQVKERYC